MIDDARNHEREAVEMFDKKNTHTQEQTKKIVTANLQSY
jgi:hypothetical protein